MALPRLRSAPVTNATFPSKLDETIAGLLSKCLFAIQAGQGLSSRESRPGPGRDSHRAADTRRPPDRRAGAGISDSQDQSRGQYRERFRTCAHPSIAPVHRRQRRSEEYTSELQSLMRISYAVICLKTKTTE